MVNSSEILSVINSRVQQIAPEAKVMLFGSRASGNSSKESDWDILILTQYEVTPMLKKDVHTALFPLSVEIGAFINALIIQENEWLHNPSYYSLRQTTKEGFIKV